MICFILGFIPRVAALLNVSWVSAPLLPDRLSCSASVENGLYAGWVISAALKPGGKGRSLVSRVELG